MGLTLLSFVAFMQLVKMVVTFSTSNMSFSLNPAPLEGGEIVRFMLRLGFCCLLETYWINPLPGASWGFNKLFSAMAQEIVKVLDQSTQAQLTNVIQEAWNKTGAPSLLSPFEIFEYVYVQLLMGVAAGIIFVINVSSFIFYAVTALFGPLFIPLYMTESFRPKFFHFVDVLLSFAMIRAVAAAFIFVSVRFLHDVSTADVQRRLLDQDVDRQHPPGFDGVHRLHHQHAFHPHDHAGNLRRRGRSYSQCAADRHALHPLHERQMSHAQTSS